MDTELLHTLFGLGSGVFWIVIAVLLIPILAIVLGIIASIFKSVLKSQERRYQMRLDAQNASVGISDNAAETLRAEIGRLRDTTTEHAMSMQHSIDRLEQRLVYLERKVCESESAQPQRPPQQRVGY